MQNRIVGIIVVSFVVFVVVYLIFQSTGKSSMDFSFFSGKTALIDSIETLNKQLESEQYSTQRINSELQKLVKRLEGKEKEIKACNEKIASYRRVLDTRVYETVDVEPTYPGGKDELGSYLTSTIKPPWTDYSKDEAKAKFRFVVKSDGSIDNIVYVSSNKEWMRRESLKAIENMPRWVPGQIEGIAVNSWHEISIVQHK